ncbi:MAG: tyrosine-type recombinase/integrase [Planctomycetota bacterium]
MPPILEGHATPELAERTRSFFLSVAAMFDVWLDRTPNANTQRTYARGVHNFIDYLGLDWPDESHALLQVTVADVQGWRDSMELAGQAPATLNARVSALSRFYKYMREAAIEMRLPIQVPNPAHAQFVRRESSDPVSPTAALTRANAHRLMGLPKADDGGDMLAARDRAILSVFLYTGARIGTVCRLDVSDFHDDDDDPILAIREKGRSSSKRRVGIHAHCAEALREYVATADLEGGPLFRARLNSRSKKLGDSPISQPSMYRLLLSYLEQLPRAMNAEGRCRYSPHSLRATTATLLDEAGVPIKRIQELLGHKDIRVTQAYIKLLRDTRQSASHDVPL